MKEIERIIGTVRSMGMDDKDLAKAIEQYVLKARIDELKQVPLPITNTYRDGRLAQLKKELGGE